MTIAVACSFLLLSIAAVAQPGDRYLNMMPRVLNVIFPLEVGPQPYSLKMILRFGDTNTQIAVVVYPEGKSEIIYYKLAGMNDDKLWELISRMVAENPETKETEIAAQLRVEVSRSSIKYESLKHALDELKSIKISPILADRVAVDAYSEYEYWYDTWQESVHYVITGPFKGSPQDRLVQWMLKFRKSFPEVPKN
jgi:hypothetical protein